MTRDPWRYRCPAGHSSWVPLSEPGVYWCKKCKKRFTEEDRLDLKDDETTTNDFGGESACP